MDDGASLMLVRRDASWYDAGVIDAIERAYPIYSSFSNAFGDSAQEEPPGHQSGGSFVLLCLDWNGKVH